MNRFNLKQGDSRFFFILSLINTAIFAVWDIVYILCTMLRNAAFSTAQTNMALTGQSVYTVEVTSPVFGILKAVVFSLPVILAVWTAALFITERKNKELCSTVLIIAAFAFDALAAILCAADIAALNMIF